PGLPANSRTARRDEAGGGFEEGGLGAERGQEFRGLIDEAAELAAGPFDAVEGNQRRLAGVGVLAGGLAEGGGVGGGVEEVVGELEGKPDRRAELGQPLAVGGRGLADLRAGLAGE